MCYLIARKQMMLVALHCVPNMAKSLQNSKEIF